MKLLKANPVITVFIVWVTMFGCKKYLDAKSNMSYSVPQTISDLQALLDYYPTMNAKDPGSGEISTTDYFLSDANYQSLSTDYFRNMYTWQKDNLFPPSSNEWANCYKAVYVSNTVLDEIGKINNDDPVARNNVKGQALVFRAKNFLQIASVWSLAYDAASSGTDLGIPLRLSSDFNRQSIRANLADTYNRIIQDLKTALPLLPVTPVTVLRPSKAAVYGLVARTYLFMREYQLAGLYADSCLQLNNRLMDFNNLSAGARYPISRFNPEVIFESYIPSPAPINPSAALIDTGLYSSYNSNDLRKIIYFKKTGSNSAFKGSYEGGTTLFSGLATDEMYLTRAESHARQGDVTLAMKDLNNLLRKRYNSSFTDLVANDAATALNLVLNERRKELLMRGLRWMDIKRLNKEGAGIILTRKVISQAYTLSPNDLRYALPIPDDVITLSGMRQNPR